jgi:hypothetical protein
LEREGKAEEAAGYDYLPLTYNLPSEYPIFLEEFKRCRDQKTTWIMKPVPVCLGRLGAAKAKASFSFEPLMKFQTGQILQPSPKLI